MIPDGWDFTVKEFDGRTQFPLPREVVADLRPGDWVRAPSPRRILRVVSRTWDAGAKVLIVEVTVS